MGRLVMLCHTKFPVSKLTVVTAIETVHQPQRQLTLRYACLQINSGILEYAFGKNFSYIYSMYANQ